MIRSFLLSSILLFGCVVSVNGMDNRGRDPFSPIENTVDFVSGAGPIISMWEAMAMTALISAYEAMYRNRSFKDELQQIAQQTAITGWFGSVYTLLAMSTGFLMKIDPFNLPKSPDRPMWQIFTKPRNIITAIMLTCCSFMSRESLLEKLC